MAILVDLLSCEHDENYAYLPWPIVDQENLMILFDASISKTSLNFFGNFPSSFIF